ncbi:hypothetical protein KSF78_0007959 [Schistosoma japonicum]|nr:hypothetical protein KSF78_0007959 [Schistosoma japonicum]
MRTIVIILTMVTVYWNFIDAFDFGKLPSSLGNLGQLKTSIQPAIELIKDNLGKSGNNLFKMRRRRIKRQSSDLEMQSNYPPSQTLDPYGRIKNPIIEGD